ncbi:CPBP family glutamic-type intramembrane protease [Ponticaulis sp.]|uniref:CPBP family intramembrane glutamic endopeptidase n=1 Tax=Ponticaulis sp. TaxID=2020902 RepID=UPI0026380678|nr:CPBP family glutamic-type intramembrane protease [Ponticaulis sp.]MDF1680402.1 CPBP family glutamic-type intramembrane protease [Ponticaulis sp.]
MTSNSAEKRAAWRSILIFLVILTLISAVWHFAIVGLAPVSIYVGALMWAPALAGFFTLKLRGRRLSELPWSVGNWRDNATSYLVPTVYVAVSYAIAWGLGFGGAFNAETIAEWAAELGLSSAPVWGAVLMVLLFATVQFSKSLGTIAGEEIGWRGFFIWELRKVLPFEGVALVSGLIWSAWHYPIVIKYGFGDPLFQVFCFTLMITSMSVIMAYFTFRSNSLWPGVMFHGAHNIYIQKIFSPLTTRNEHTQFWIDEYGLMVPLIVTLMAVYFWRRAKAEGL